MLFGSSFSLLSGCPPASTSSIPSKARCVARLHLSPCPCTYLLEIPLSSSSPFDDAATFKPAVSIPGGPTMLIREFSGARSAVPVPAPAVDLAALLVVSAWPDEILSFPALVHWAPSQTARASFTFTRHLPPLCLRGPHGLISLLVGLVAPCTWFAARRCRCGRRPLPIQPQHCGFTSFLLLLGPHTKRGTPPLAVVVTQFVFTLGLPPEFVELTSSPPSHPMPGAGLRKVAPPGAQPLPSAHPPHFPARSLRTLFAR